MLYLSSYEGVDVEDKDELCKAAQIVSQALFALTCYEQENGVCSQLKKKI